MKKINCFHRMPRQSKRKIWRSGTNHLTLLLVFCFASFLHPHVLNVSALEATFTPAPDKDTGSTDGPLPASQNQRDSLLEIDKLITSSSNPGEMLQKIAEGNGMTAESLGDMLLRNRRDMDMANSGNNAPIGLDTIPRRMLRVFSSLALVVAKSVSSHPRVSVLIVLVLVAMVSLLISAPITGVVISTERGLMSTGHTTIFAPPTEYLSKFVKSDTFQSKERTSSIDTPAGGLSSLFDDDDVGKKFDNGVPIKNLSKKQKKYIKFVVSAKKNIPFEVLLPSDDDMEFIYEKETDGKVVKNKKTIMADLEEKAWDDAMMLAFTSAERILLARRFTEYVPSPPNQMRLFSATKSDSHGSRHENAALIFKSMGDWQRFGIQPLRVVFEQDAADSRSLVYHTLTGGHFDGELRITVKKIDNNEEESSIAVTVTMLVPNNGRKMNSNLASKMVLFLAESTAASIITGAKQILSRKQQSTLYRGRAKTKASIKRHIAYENLKQMEEMAEDRRRRWQRSNPDAGRYRASGDAMRSPGGGPAFCS